MTSDAEIAAAWSAIVEPGHHDAARLWELLGPEEGLAWMRDPLHRTLPVGNSSQLHQRTHPRAVEVTPAAELEKAARLGAMLIWRGQPQWPEALAHLGIQEPLTLWAKGDVALLSARQVSVVGARACTSYGSRVAEEIAWDLAGQGIVVTSGGAYGIDAAAHRGALGCGSTIAVLCGGLGNLYPRGNHALLERIGEEGLLVSEVPPGARPARWRFLERNRVIAAVAEVTIVIEAGLRSGALATANRATNIGRDVGAVPGPVTSAASSGCHQLLKEGASLVRGSGDVLEMLGISDESPDQVFPISDGHAHRVLQAFPTSRKADTHTLVIESGLGCSDVQAALLQLKLAGAVALEGETWRKL